MPLVGAPSMAHSQAFHTFAPHFQTKLPPLVHVPPPFTPFKTINYPKTRSTARSSNLRGNATSEPPSLPDPFVDNVDQVQIKFQPFVARNELRRRMLGYYRELPTSSGQILVVQPVSEEWIEPAADVLTDAFADSIGYVTMYRNFLRRQIRNYLRSHMNLPPKTVCLVALLVNKEVLEKQPRIDEDSGFYSDIEVNDGAGGDGMSDASTFVSTSSRAADVAGGMMRDGMGNNFWPSFSNNNTTTAGEGSSEGEIGTEGEQCRQRQDASTATLVGAVEVSFTESTRSKEWTGLNPPPERPYLCNMAVAAETRRQGIGGLLLEAAEDLVKRVGEDQMYLHLRFKDAPAAALYRKAGYTPAAQDSILVRLVGQDRRWLMKKILKE